MNQETKSVDQVLLSNHSAVYQTIYDRLFYKICRKILAQKHEELETAFFEQQWIRFYYGDAEGYWNKDTAIAIPVEQAYDTPKKKRLFGFDCSRLECNEVEKLFGENSNCPSAIMEGIRSSKSYYTEHWIKYNGGTFSVEHEEHRIGSWNDNNSFEVPIVRIAEWEFKEKIYTGKFRLSLHHWLEFVWDTENEDQKDDADKLQAASELIGQQDINELSEGVIDSIRRVFGIQRSEIHEMCANEIRDCFFDEEFWAYYTQSLLECDTARADLEKYDKKCLTDVNSGHWELWNDEDSIATDGQVPVSLWSPLQARNPLSDIHENGLIGIDFGTKSTIVSVQEGHEHTTLLRVGVGKLNKAPQAYHYENPTIMEFIDLPKFLQAYKTRSGRPETSINDLRVSHAAERDLKSCDNNSFFDSFFYDIKQWCGDERRNVKLIDQKNRNHEYELPPFISLGENDFNPLELYAYYLGLYINNMREGIYLDYVISFPVTYKLDVKTKILESFRAGLWKSLPETVQKNEQASRQFRVRMGVSEPEAYAITALRGYGFEPENEKDKILYGIFDFGGGTTDFDFGIWRGADDTLREEEDKDFVIEHLNSEGDKYLGGENLLELLAFEVFKANNDFMRTGKQTISEDDTSESVGFSFTLPPECVKPSGCETTINHSPSAKRNTKQLMEALRPFWEGIIGIAGEEERHSDSFEPKNADRTEYHGYWFRNDDKMQFPLADDGTITVDLFDNNGELQSSQKLFIQKQDTISVDLVRILEERIERGVESFFSSIMLLFSNKIVLNSNIDEMQIFLAGNSSKSPILRRLFDQYIEKEDKAINHGIPGNTHFRLFPPLGSTEAIALQKERGISINTDITAPTGKTGVAYGLIQGREGGPIRVISRIHADSQSKFRFNIGKARKGKFSIVLDRNEAVYGQWVRFAVASCEDFEIYYTSLPSAEKRPVDDPTIRKIRCRIPIVDSDADIFIRTIEEAPEDLEYCVSIGKEPDNTQQIIRIHLEE